MMTDWHFLDSLVVRMTGFPAEHLTRLRFGESVASVQKILACEAALDRCRQQLLSHHFPLVVDEARQDEESAQTLLSLLSTWRRAVGRGRPCALQELPPAYASFYARLQQWNQLVQQHSTLLTQGQRVWQEELKQQRVQLWQTMADPLIQEAIFLSSPSMYHALHRQLRSKKRQKRNSATRKFERRLMAYLQRLCTKNETQSFFGPINYGRLDESQSANVQVSLSAAPLRQRVAFASFWLAEAVAEAMSAEPDFQPYLQPRRSPFCVPEGDALYFPAWQKSQPLPPTAMQLWRLADGSRTLADLAAQVEATSAQVKQMMQRLQQLKAVVNHIIVPGTISDPLAYLQTWLAAVPESVPARAHWSAIITDFQDRAAAFATADLPQRVQILAAMEEQFKAMGQERAQRGKGTMYADRLLIFEECWGQLETFTVGGALADVIQKQLKPVFGWWHAYGRWQQQRDQQAAQAVWQTLTADGQQAVPFLTYLQALARREDEAGEVIPEQSVVTAFMADLAQLIEARSDGHCARLYSHELPVLPLPPDSEACDCCSIDLMVAADSWAALEAGQFQLILGEGHPQPLPLVFPTAYFQGGDTETVAPALSEALRAQPGGPLAAQLAFRRQNKIYPYPLPGATIELRPRMPYCEAIPAAAVEVRQNEEGWLRLWAEGQWLRLYPSLTRRQTGLDPLAPFSFTAVEPLPIDLGEHTPRIEIDDMVYQRETWRLPTEPLQAWASHDFELFLDAWRWKTQLELPDELFVRLSSEPKPLYVDLSNYFFVEVLQALSRQSDTLTVTEMLPTTQQLWLETAAGSHCCELRTLAVVDDTGSDE